MCRRLFIREQGRIYLRSTVLSDVHAVLHNIDFKTIEASGKTGARKTFHARRTKD